MAAAAVAGWLLSTAACVCVGCVRETLLLRETWCVGSEVTLMMMMMRDCREAARAMSLPLCYTLHKLQKVINGLSNASFVSKDGAVTCKAHEIDKTSPKAVTIWRHVGRTDWLVALPTTCRVVYQRAARLHAKKIAKILCHIFRSFLLNFATRKCNVCNNFATSLCFQMCFAVPRITRALQRSTQIAMIVKMNNFKPNVFCIKLYYLLMSKGLYSGAASPKPVNSVKWLLVISNYYLIIN